MRIIPPSVDVIENIKVQPYKMIERIGRICYKSEDHISDNSATKFVAAMCKNHHYAMLEHSHVLLGFDYVAMQDFINALTTYSSTFNKNLSCYLNITNLRLTTHDLFFVSGSLRAWIEVLDYIEGSRVGVDIKHLFYSDYPELFAESECASLFYKTSTPDRYCVHIWDWDEFIVYIETTPHLGSTFRRQILMCHVPITCIFTCDLLVHRELVRHRPASFAGESTRYCNYSNNKFNGEITVVLPQNFSNETDNPVYTCWYDSCTKSERAYFDLLDIGILPQDARSVLPVSTKSDLALTCTEAEWEHILDLRMRGTTGKPHPQVEHLMKLAYPKLVEYSHGRLRKDSDQ